MVKVFSKWYLYLHKSSLAWIKIHFYPDLYKHFTILKPAAARNFDRDLKHPAEHDCGMGNILCSDIKFLARELPFFYQSSGPNQFFIWSGGARTLPLSPPYAHTQVQPHTNKHTITHTHAKGSQGNRPLQNIKMRHKNLIP